MVASIDRTEPVPARLPRDWTWLNWTLTLLTPAGAALVMTHTLRAAVHAGGCGVAGCPDLGANGAVFNMLFYGAAAVAAVVLLGAFFAARRPAGVVIPLSGWALLAADLVVSAATFG